MVGASRELLVGLDPSAAIWLAGSLVSTEVLHAERDTRGVVGNQSLNSPSRQPGNAGVYNQNILLIQPAATWAF